MSNDVTEAGLINLLDDPEGVGKLRSGGDRQRPRFAMRR